MLDYTEVETSPNSGTSPSLTFGQFLVAFLVSALFFSAILIVVILVPPRPGTPPSSIVGSNIFEGYGDTAATRNANAHRAEENAYITAQTVDSLKLKCKVNVAALFNETFLAGVTFNSASRGVMQVSETHAYMQLSQSFGASAQFQSSIIAINRETCNIDRIVHINDINTLAVSILAQKYPTEYNQTLVTSFQRDTVDDLCFSPIVLSGEYLITGDGCPSEHFFTNEYYESVPQANGGPILRQTWGIDNNTRHFLAGNIYILNATTLALIDADRVADAGEASAGGNCNVNGIAGVPQVVHDNTGTNATYILIGSHSPTTNGLHTRLDYDSGRAEIGKMNGNRPTQRNSFKRFHLNSGGTIVENWRRYDTPTPLFAGDYNPMNSMDELITDTQADELNYYGSGFAHSALVDLERRQIGVVGGTAFVMPLEAAVSAYLAQGTWDAQTGGLGYPKCAHTEWTRLFNEATNAEQQQALYVDFGQTQKNREAGLALLVNTTFYADLLADTFAVLDFDTGAIVWKKRRVATNSDAAEFAWKLLLGVNFDNDDYIKSQYLSGSGDHDWNLSPVYVMQANGTGVYSLGATDGSIQVFHPDTGATLFDMKVLTGQWLGSINSGGTIDADGNVYYSGQWSRNLENLSDLSHIAKIDRESGQIQVSDNANCPRIGSSDLCTDATGDWYSNNFVDTFNDLGNSAGDEYVDQDIALPLGVGLLFKSPVSGNITVRAVTRDPTNERTKGGASTAKPNLGEAVLTSVNDVLIATGHYGNIQLWDAVSMSPIRIINVLPDVESLAGKTDGLVCGNGVAIAGKELWFTCGSTEWDAGAGAFVYSYSL